MQLYRGLDIGTAKADRRRARARCPHHLLDVLDVTETASVAAYQRAARAVVERVLAAGRTPVLVGGSGLYVQAVVDELEFPGTDPALRAELAAELDRVGPAALHARLADARPGRRRRGAAQQRAADRAGAGGDRADRPPVHRAPARGRGAALRRRAARGRPAHRRARRAHRPPGGADVRGRAGRRDPRPAARACATGARRRGRSATSRSSPRWTRGDLEARRGRHRRRDAPVRAQAAVVVPARPRGSSGCAADSSDVVDRARAAVARLGMLRAVQFSKGHGTENTSSSSPIPTAPSTSPPTASPRCATATAASAPTGCCASCGGPRSPRGRCPPTTSSGSWTTATPTAASPRCAATACGSTPPTSPTAAGSPTASCGSAPAAGSARCTSRTTRSPSRWGRSGSTARPRRASTGSCSPASW